jgi:DNA-binding CsgD family transcriptional regulator
MRVFLDEGAPMAKLLRHTGSHGVSPKYVAGLLSHFDGEIGITPATQQPLIAPLTERELEVLRLLADGLSNQEIARQLVAALGRAKTHTASLYRKLMRSAVLRRWRAPENSAFCNGLLPTLLNPKQTLNTPFDRWQASCAGLYCALTIKK